ncbi:MAG: hypothetical protein LUC85_11945, partial [Bacteroidales bacterium]|nr:hypothetical protein [Bacteroidales bacterium]
AKNSAWLPPHPQISFRVNPFPKSHEFHQLPQISFRVNPFPKATNSTNYHKFLFGSIREIRG